LAGLASEASSEEVYNEQAFRYFLELERRRSELSRRPFLLLLIDLQVPSTVNMCLDEPTSRQLFSALALGLRETDFIGWYREDRVAGAVLTQHAETHGTDIPEAVRKRVLAVLVKKLSSRVLRRLRVRVYQVPTSVKEQA
jgi:GGDEF domain-containing protein